LSLGPQLEAYLGTVRRELDAVNAAREEGLAQCRRTIRLAGRAVGAVHRLDRPRATALLAESEEALRRAQEVLSPFPVVAYAGFLHDAEREFAEASLVMALVSREPLEGAGELRVGLAAWMNGLAEAASEMRRHLLDRLRAGELQEAERLLEVMEDIYDFLVGIDYPDAITGGLRRSADSLRAVLERSRGDLTTTILQFRLQSALERGVGQAQPPPSASS
jgi:translin